MTNHVLFIIPLVFSFFFFQSSILWVFFSAVVTDADADGVIVFDADGADDKVGTVSDDV